MMKKWSGAYEKAKGLRVDYNSTGSGAGITQMIEKKVKFACSDAPLTEDQLKKAKDADNAEPVHIPLVIGAVAVFYNLPGVDKPLNFDGPLLADIFLGKVTKWNDARIKALNEGVSLPDLDILPVARADHSGTTYIWTSYLTKVSPEWKDKVGVGTLPSWPDNIKNREQKSDGVAGFVAQTKGAIGYVELRYTKDKKDMKYGTVKNKAGKAVLPSLDTTVAAAEAIKEADIPEDLRLSMVDPDGADAYPICGSVWAVCLTKQSPEDAAALKEFFTWALHDGQGLTKAEDYAPLPKALVDRAQKKVDLITGQ
jgi:phosphate transport system substrate-binding protein